MANDRVMIRCKGCGGWKMLLKHYVGDGPLTWDNEILGWLDDHAYCHPRAYESDLGGDPGYELMTEEDSRLDPRLQNMTPRR